MSLSNPNKLVNVQELQYFEEKLGAKYATQDGLDEVKNIIGYDKTVEYVDLGLPSGTLWARCNIGATVETDYGDYYKYGSGSTKYPGGSSYSGRENPLAASADTATQVMGRPWHMPTKAQFEELIANTTKSWQTDFNGSGVNGMKFTAANGNYIFIPAGGESTNPSEIGVYGNLWTSTPKSSLQVYEFSVRGYNQSAQLVEVGPNFGFNVRGVMEKMSDKANRVIDSTENHIATLDSHGNPKDSGKSVDDFADANHTHDDRYYTESEVDEKIQQVVEKLEGPYYDEEHCCVVYPDYETAFYDADSRGIIV